MFSRPQRNWDRSAWLAPLGLAVAVVVAYVNSLSGPFVFDDRPSIVDNTSIRALNALGHVLSPPHGEGITVEGRPLLNLSLAVNYAFGGTAVAGYHALNILIHLGCAWLLFAITRRTIRSSALPPDSAPGATAVAWAVALLWAVHPLQTESVTYIVQRAESLMALCYLLTLYCFIRGAESPRSSGWFAAAIASAAAGMATKEVMVTAPIIVLLYDRTFVSGTFRSAWQRHGRVHFALAGTWLLLVWLVIGAGDRGGTIGTAAGVTPWQYACCQARALVHYLELAAWPHPLIFDYGPDFVSFAQCLPYAVVDLALLGVTTVALWRVPALGFVGAWFFLILAPTTSFVGGTRQMLAEHRMYLSLAAPLMLGVVGLRAALGSAGTVAAAAALALAGTSAARNGDYRNEAVLYRDTVAKRPDNPFARYNLGKALAEQGDLREAIVQDQAAIRLRPGLASAHDNLAKALADLGRTGEAVVEYEAALRLAPKDARAHYNLGLALLALDRKDEALTHFQAAAQLDPKDLEARDNWGAVLLERHDLAGAAAQFRAVLAMNPNIAEAHCNLGTVLLLQGDAAAAVRELEEAVRLDPRLIPARERLTLARARLDHTP